MAYIGKTPQVGNYVKLDAISCTSTNTYNLTQDSVAFTPESALHMMVSLNGVIQAPLTSFSVSGSTITFLPSSGTLSSSDTIDFILVLGNTLDIGTPSDSTVTNAKTNFVSTSSSAGLQIKGDNTTAGTLQLNCEQNSHGIKLQSPAHSGNQSYTLKFPIGNVTAGKFLKIDSVSGSGTTGIGTMTFADAGVTTFTSAETTISASTKTTLAHSLGAIPFNMDLYLVCKTAGNGFAVDDIVKPTQSYHSTAGTSSIGATLSADATNIYLTTGPNSAGGMFKAFNQDTGADVTLTNSSFKMIVKAFV